MTPKELFERLQDQLQTCVWEGTSNKIFGDAVYIVPRIPIEGLPRWGRCCCFIMDEGTVFDDSHPNLMWQNFSISVYTENVFDGLGSGVMVGANRVAGQSYGAGTLDLHYALTRFLNSITALVGRINFMEESSQETKVLSGANAPNVTKLFSCSALVNTGSTTPSEDEILQVPGFLYWNPTSLVAPIDYGDLLGYTKDGVTLDPGQKYRFIKGEETGEAVISSVYIGAQPRVSVILRNWNANVLTSVFPGQGGTTKIDVPGSVLTGTLTSSTTYAKPLLFLPSLSTDPCILLKRAVPHISQAAKMAWDHTRPLNLLVEFEGIWVSSGAATQYYIGPVSGASL